MLFDVGLVFLVEQQLVGSLLRAFGEILFRRSHIGTGLHSNSVSQGAKAIFRNSQASHLRSRQPVTSMWCVTDLELWDGLSEVWEDLGPRERKVLATIAVRLLAGQKAYGLLTVGKKDWRREAKEEAMDMCVYLATLLEDDNEHA